MAAKQNKRGMLIGARGRVAAPPNCCAAHLLLRPAEQLRLSLRDLSNQWVSRCARGQARPLVAAARTLREACCCVQLLAALVADISLRARSLVCAENQVGWLLAGCSSTQTCRCARCRWHYALLTCSLADFSSRSRMSRNLRCSCAGRSVTDSMYFSR